VNFTFPPFATLAGTGCVVITGNWASTKAWNNPRGLTPLPVIIPASFDAAKPLNLPSRFADQIVEVFHAPGRGPHKGILNGIALPVHFSGIGPPKDLAVALM